MGPVAILDKSALQALALDEAVWLEAFFQVNIAPVFYVEVVADLEKPVGGGGTPEGVVGGLADKTPSDAVPNVHHRQLLVSELLGGVLEMDGRPVVAGHDLRQAPDGSTGWHISEFPEAAMLHRWQRHEFAEVERGVARRWRSGLAREDPSRLVALASNILPVGAKMSDLRALKAFVDEFCTSADPAVVALAMELLDVPDDCRRIATGRWEAARRPALPEFAPYAAHLFKVDLLFYLGIRFSFIDGNRASNKVDMAYLHYLPFADAFVSGDRLHKRTVPLFLRPDQTFVDRDELKAALRELDTHYDAMSDETKALGVLAFAAYPPPDLDNAVTRLWDNHTDAAWREVARTHIEDLRRPRDTQAERETVEELNRKLAEATPVEDGQSPLSGQGADYVVRQRWVPARKGKWRIVPDEALRPDGPE